MFIQPLASAGASQISFHPESLQSFQNIDGVIDEIVKNGMKCGIAVKPQTDIDSLLPYITKYIAYCSRPAITSIRYPEEHRIFPICWL